MRKRSFSDCLKVMFIKECGTTMLLLLWKCSKKQVTLQSFRKKLNYYGNCSWKLTHLSSSLKHEHIVQYYGTFVANGNRQFIVTELMTRGDAQDMIKNSSLSTKDLVKMWINNFTISLTLIRCLDAAKGMTFIHSKNIIHRDLALRNLLVTDGPNGSYIVKVYRN